MCVHSGPGLLLLYSQILCKRTWISRFHHSITPSGDDMLWVFYMKVVYETLNVISSGCWNEDRWVKMSYQGNSLKCIHWTWSLTSLPLCLCPAVLITLRQQRVPSTFLSIGEKKSTMNSKIRIFMSLCRNYMSQYIIKCEIILEIIKNG